MKYFIEKLSNWGEIMNDNDEEFIIDIPKSLNDKIFMHYKYLKS